MKPYLEPSIIIDWQNPAIIQLAERLASQSTTETAKNCFEWVRDNIKHSGEFKLNPITLYASDVLKHKTGFCFAKSHLLAALLRANSIPAGLCYQCVSINDDSTAYCLHGLNAVYLDEFSAWYRLDPRGNNTQINAQFLPPTEQLAFPVKLPQEIDYLEICAEPLPEIISLLTTSNTYQDVFKSLPSTALVKPISALKVAGNLT